MRMDEAWAATQHGGKLARPDGIIIERWMGEKPGLKSSFDRWLDENITLISAADLMAGDWYANA